MQTKVTAPFATPLEIAKILGVPRRRALALIRLVRLSHAVTQNNELNGRKGNKGLVKRKLSKRQMRAKSSKDTR